jgi:hypothetical protein
MAEVFIQDALFLVQGKEHDQRSGTMINDVCRWLIYKIVDIIRYRAVQHPAVIVSGIITNVFIIISVLSAFPWVRK